MKLKPGKRVVVFGFSVVLVVFVEDAVDVIVIISSAVVVLKISSQNVNSSIKSRGQVVTHLIFIIDLGVKMPIRYNTKAMKAIPQMIDKVVMYIMRLRCSS